MKTPLTKHDIKHAALAIMGIISTAVLISVALVYCAPAAAQALDLEGVKSETGDGPLTFGWNLLVYAGPVVLLTPLVKRLVDQKVRGRVADAKLPYAAAALGVSLLTLVWGAIDLLSKMLTGYSTDEVFPGGFGPAAASFIAVATAPGFLREATKPRDPSRMSTLAQANGQLTPAESYDARARERGFLSDSGFAGTRLLGLLAAAGLVAALALSTGCTSPGAATPQEAAAVRGQAADFRQLQTAAGRDPRVPEVFVSAIDKHGDFLDALANWLDGTAPFPHATLPEPE